MRLDPAWLAAAVPRGIACAHGEREVVLGLRAPFEALVGVLDVLVATPEAEALAAAAGTPADAARDALATLREHGVLADGALESPRPPSEGVPLAEAVRLVVAGEAVECAWTRDEVLVLPAGIGAREARRAVRAFVAALRPDARLEAYAALATYGSRSLFGDLPDAEPVEQAVAAARAADPGAVHAVALVDGRRWSVAPDALHRLDMRAPHRLGPLQEVRRPAAGPPLRGRRATSVAEYAVANLRSPWPRTFRIGRGTSPSADCADLVARAEAAERYGAYEVDAGRLRRAAARDLDGRVAPDALQRFSARQYAEHADLQAFREDRPLLWTRARTRRGDERWVPAEAVHVGLAQPGAPQAVVTSSSGLAAGPTFEAAAEGALRELIERDAFMWTWVQRVSRERVDPRGLDPDAAALARALDGMGYEVALVNLTLDTKPVIMAVVHTEQRMHVAAACRESPREAAAKALDEAALVVALEHPHDPPDLRPEQVEVPEEHMWLHLRREGVDRAAFLFASRDTIELDDVVAVSGPVVEAVEAVGEALLVDLSSPRTAPFDVARALVPGLVPISFGWDREPLGMERLASPARTVDGRALGGQLDLGSAPPILPHPFP